MVNLVEEDVLSSCRYWICDLALASQISLVVFIIIQVCVRVWVEFIKVCQQGLVLYILIYLLAQACV